MLCAFSAYLSDEKDPIANMANISALLFEALEAGKLGWFLSSIRQKACSRSIPR